MSYTFSVILITLGFVVISYLLGSVNFALLVTRAFNGSDIRESGSGNAGMTNVMRTVGFLPGLITFAGDFIKACAGVALGKYCLVPLYQLVAPASVAAEPDFDYIMAVLPMVAAALCGFFCMLGHIFPLYFHFRGGKGIVVAAGTSLMLDWRTFLMVLGVFAVVFLVSRIISLSSIIAALCYPWAILITFSCLIPLDPVNAAAVGAHHPLVMATPWMLTILAGGCALLVIIKHKDNIYRLLHGQEKRLTLKKKEQ